jgi:hypothetical protein
MNLESITAAAAPRSSRRASTRREVSLACQAVREHDFVLIAERTLDVSIDGVLLPVHRRVLTGESVIVSFQIPGMWIDAEGTITRVVHGRRPEDDGMAVGVEFDVIAPAARAALAGFLHGRPPPLPRRGPLARLRRGLTAPQLADHGLMLAPIVSNDYVSESDIEDVTDEDDFDPLGVLQEVATAWKRLVMTGA